MHQAAYFWEGSQSSNQVTEAPNVLMAADDRKYLELLNSQLKPMRGETSSTAKLLQSNCRLQKFC